VLAVLKVLGGAGALVAVLIGSRFGGRWPHVIGLITIAGGTVLLFRAGGLVEYALGAWAWEFGFSLSQCYQMAAVPRLDRSGRLTVLVPAAAGLGAAFGPAIAGYLKTASGSYAPVLVFTTLTVAVVAVAYGWLMTPRNFT
jgi:hypothetical protein